MKSKKRSSRPQMSNSSRKKSLYFRGCHIFHEKSNQEQKRLFFHAKASEEQKKVISITNAKNEEARKNEKK